MSDSKKILNKKIILWTGIASIVIVLIFVIAILSYKNVHQQMLSKYSLCLTYDDENHVLAGKEQVEYVNNTDNMFTRIYFHLYPNAFREGAKASVVSQNNVGEAYPNGYSYGEIKIKGVKCFDGENALYEVCGEDENILAISLKQELYPEESVILEIEFETIIANINHRLGYGENTINFGNFYPIACVYESGIGFSQNLYHSNGDPFYSDCANYEVNLIFNSKYDLASSGEVKVKQTGGGNTNVVINAENVRDFCFVLSENFDKVSKSINGIEINYFGYKGDHSLETSLQTCVDAVETFENLFGDYPYAQLSVVKSNFVHGGMEYPNIVLISDTIESQTDLNYVIIHEIAHQWWYGIVGNDEYNNAWMDESLAEYSTLLFYKKNKSYGEDYNALVTGAIESYKLFEEVYIKVTGNVDGRMSRPLCDYKTEPEYVQCVYTKGVVMWSALHDMVGEKKLISTLKNYYNEFKFKNACPADMISLFVSSCGKSVEGFFDSWLEGKVVIK